MSRRRPRKSTMYLRAGIDSLHPMKQARSALPGFAIAIAVLIAGLLLALTVGRYPVGLGDLFSVLAAKLAGHRADVSPAVESVILQVRGPRVLAAMLVGAALAVAGTAFQGLFRNPLVSPDILGASSGAALGAVVGIYLSLSVFAIPAIAFVGGPAAHRHRRSRHAGALGRGCDGGDHRRGWPRGAASGAIAGWAGLCAAVAGRGDPRRRLSFVDRHVGAHHGAGRDSARHFDRRD